MFKNITFGVFLVLAVAGFLIVIIFNLNKEENKLATNEALSAPPVSNQSTSTLAEIKDALVKVSDFVFSPLEEAVNRVITPGPLNLLAGAGGANYEVNLTRAGVIAKTNEERIRENLPALAENPKLNEAARYRLEDIFKKQYFAHESPSGQGVAEAVGSTNYGYIVVGENLALGGFKNDEAVVRAWLLSPGHKANMLARRYFDIGVAVGEGNFKGTRARLAVQVFGTPLTVCPTPNESLKTKIYSNKARIDKLEPELASLKLFIDKQGPFSTGLSVKIKEYNGKASEFNNLIQVTQVSIAEYNNQVKRFNSCAETK